MIDLQWLDDEQSLRITLFSELEQNMQALIARVSRLDCGCSILRLLGDHPKVLLTAEDIVFHVKGLPAGVETSLDALVELGLVQRRGISNIAFYGLTPDAQLQTVVRRLNDWQDRWHLRMARLERLVTGVYPIQ